MQGHAKDSCHFLLHLDVRHAPHYNAFVSEAAPDNAINVTIRLTPELIQQIDALVERERGGPGEITRSSLVRHWIERGLKEARRQR
jgi:hypothetical protein